MRRGTGVGAVEAAAAVLGPGAVRDWPLGRHTTYRVGGPAALYYEAHGPEDLERVAAALAASELPLLVVGRGSNLLVADAGFPGLVVGLGAGFGEVRREGVSVRAGGAVALPTLARKTAAAGLSGFEWAVGVPGSVGGAVRMNAGGHGSDLAASLRRVMLFDARTGVAAEVAAAALSLGYRRSAVRRHEVVVWAEVELAEGERAASERLVAEIVRWRRRHQPGGQNAGSVFVNPPTDSAGRLVEVAGLKGLRKGSAEVSTKHGNFFQADPDGSADDVRALIDEVARLVDERLGVRLEPEVDLIGFPDTYPFVEVKG